MELSYPRKKNIRWACANCFMVMSAFARYMPESIKRRNCVYTIVFRKRKTFFLPNYFLMEYSWEPCSTLFSVESALLKKSFAWRIYFISCDSMEGEYFRDIFDFFQLTWTEKVFLFFLRSVLTIFRFVCTFHQRFKKKEELSANEKNFQLSTSCAFSKLL